MDAAKPERSVSYPFPPGGHKFEGLLDRSCEVCGGPDRDGLHRPLSHDYERPEDPVAVGCKLCGYALDSVVHTAPPLAEVGFTPATGGRVRKVRIDPTDFMGVGCVHELKCLPRMFSKVENGTKTFEIRKDDRGFKIGDVLRLRSYRPPSEGASLVGDSLGTGYLGPECYVQVSYLTSHREWPNMIAKGHVVMAIELLQTTK